MWMKSSSNQNFELKPKVDLPFIWCVTFLISINIIFQKKIELDTGIILYILIFQMQSTNFILKLKLINSLILKIK